jgi:hypothetical protein
MLLRDNQIRTSCSCRLPVRSFAKHIFNEIFPVPQFMLNHNVLSYNCFNHTQTRPAGEAILNSCFPAATAYLLSLRNTPILVRLFLINVTEHLKQNVSLTLGICMQRAIPACERPHRHAGVTE